MKFLLLAGLASVVLAPGGTHSMPAPAWGDKPLAVLLVGPGGNSDWDSVVEKLHMKFGAKIPLEIVSGTFGTKGLQRALDRLSAARTKKVVVVPLFLYSRSQEADQLKYLLGMNKYPSKEYAEFWKLPPGVIKRAKTKAPIVMSGGLDDHPLVADILRNRAEKMSSKPAQEAVVLVGIGSPSDEENEMQKGLMQSLAGKMLIHGKFQTVHSALLRPATEAKPRLESESDKSLRTLIKELSLKTRVIVLPYLLTRDGSERTIRKKLDNLFFRWKGDALLPDKRIADWVELQIEATAKLPDMVLFKDAGLALPQKKPSLKKERIVQ